MKPNRVLILFIIFLNIFFTTSIISSNTVNNKRLINKKYIKAYCVYLKARNIISEEEAVKLYMKSIRIYKYFPEPYFRLAEYYYKNTQYGKTAKLLKEVFRYDSYFKILREKNEYFKFALKFYAEQTDYNSVIKYLLKINRLVNKNIYLFMLGQNYYFIHSYEDAIQYLNKYIENFNTKNMIRGKHAYKKNNIFSAYEILIDSYVKLNKYTDALQYLKAYYLLKPSKNTLKKISILSNNLRYYDKK